MGNSEQFVVSLLRWGDTFSWPIGHSISLFCKSFCLTPESDLMDCLERRWKLISNSSFSLYELNIRNMSVQVRCYSSIQIFSFNKLSFWCISLQTHLYTFTHLYTWKKFIIYEIYVDRFLTLHLVHGFPVTFNSTDTDIRSFNK